MHHHRSFPASTAVGIALGALVLFGTYGKAWPQPLCAPWFEIKAKFAAKYQEVPTSGGIINEKAAAQVLVSPDGATWTLVIVNSTGMACVAAAGTGWEPGKNPTREGRT